MGNIYGNNVIYIQLCCKGSFMLSQCELEIKDNIYMINSVEDDEGVKQMNFDISNIKEITPISGIFDSSYKDISVERSRIQKLEKAIYYAKVLSIIVLNPDINQKTILINALGAESALRSAKDGFTYFGAKKRDSPEGSIINDIILPFVNPELAKNYRGKHFQISYDLSRDVYYIKDLKLGFGTYFKLTDSIELKNSMLFLLGDTFILVSFIALKSESSRIRLKIYGKGTGDVFYFNASDYSENYITLGRQENCEVKLTGNLVSKVHCTIFYTPEKGWILFDGDIKSNQPSTNGTWIYMGDNMEIYDSMIFKSGKVMFKVAIL
jgi:hypothetical protein